MSTTATEAKYRKQDLNRELKIDQYFAREREVRDAEINALREELRRRHP
jgi:hypothetical protein